MDKLCRAALHRTGTKPKRHGEERKLRFGGKGRELTHDKTTKLVFKQFNLDKRKPKRPKLSRCSSGTANQDDK
jgi:hypothetical protein